mmetsp:Transcript_19574/g.27936  ORF Transcript_19574/g.27936 Transcript_19574/m.27936 type:complete len:282 (-) Transcript_19574:2946-3791(-)
MAKTQIWMSALLSKRLCLGFRTTRMNECYRKVSTDSSEGAKKTLQRDDTGAKSNPQNDRYVKSQRTMAEAQDLFVVCTKTNRRVPSIELARRMPISLRDVSNEVLLSHATRENHEACAEILTRHVMSRENVGYAEAEKNVDEIRRLNERFMEPFAYGHLTVGSLAMLAGFASFPLVFDINTVLFFNEYFVTTEVPPVDELETTLEVGAWAWNWMEPPLGQLSFFLLCMQLAAQQYKHTGFNRFFYRPLEASVTHIVQKYSQYDEAIFRNFCNSQKYFMSRK